LPSPCAGAHTPPPNPILTRSRHPNGSLADEPRIRRVASAELSTATFASFAIDRSRTESERYRYVDVCHRKHRVGVRAVAVIALLVCTRFVAFVKTVLASAFGQLDQSDEWRSLSILSDTPVVAVCCP
jgi:hypothetical protein